VLYFKTAAQEARVFIY